MLTLILLATGLCMSTELLGVVVTFLLTVLLAYPLGRYIAGVYKSERINLFERLIYRVGGINVGDSMNWKQFLKAMLSINLLWFVHAFFVLMVQGKLPLNPSGNPGPTPYYYSVVDTAGVERRGV